MSIPDFKKYIYKSVITMWNQLKLHSLKDLTFYVLSSVRIRPPKILSSLVNNDIINESENLNRTDAEISTKFIKESLNHTQSISNVKNGAVEGKFIAIFYAKYRPR